ncbi:Adenosine receptor A3 [Trichoplax sp. H2]|uniref:G-protein coupled receptors family 1 profile domain-containing protein n=1 Tax=Trichoplax adhaerens TaxID=10228 RepID=B3S5X2_TRIAD|nr:hypothetical protein TRIADDRAFT_59538 [Trichoplax adhaerens]EDV21883.1 hypothetical protein TRIADDRAFT_59538 [Trichoplax adhaerens]RDD39061.1 Adenosine receptor A3 [Trichoplax sp. H2]|eukprot:XP_002115520.1 hypothetical protein TRIADDRAFT_59538 [Trichoplax adhaerens]
MQGNEETTASAQYIPVVNIAAMVIWIVIGASAIICNVFVIVIIQRNKRLRCLSMYKLMTSMFAGNLVLAIFYVCLKYAFPFHNLLKVYCSVSILLAMGMAFNTAIHHSAISIDRYIAVSRPIKYRRLTTSHGIRLIIAIIWMLSLLIGFTPVLTYRRIDTNKCYGLEDYSTFDANHFMAITGIFFLVPLAIISYCYVRIYTLINRRWRVRFNSANTKCTSRFRKKNTKMAKQMAVMTLVYAAMGFPYTVTSVLHYTKVSTNINFTSAYFVPRIIFFLYPTVSTLLYCYYIKSLRAAIIIVFKKKPSPQSRATISLEASLASSNRISSKVIPAIGKTVTNVETVDDQVRFAAF